MCGKFFRRTIIALIIAAGLITQPLAAYCDTEDTVSSDETHGSTQSEDESVSEDTNEDSAKDTTEDTASQNTEVVVNISLTDGGNVGADINEAIYNASCLASENVTYRVVVPAGSYYLEEAICLYSNVTLDLSSGVVLNGKIKKGYLIYTLSPSELNSEQAAGYGGIENATIIGGTFYGNENKSGIMVAGHGKNITLNGCVFYAGESKHMLEVAAVDGFNVLNCTFRDLDRIGSYTEQQEALQLDVSCSSGALSAVYNDGTELKNVVIDGCTFMNMPCAIGSHSVLVGSYITGVTITNNTFKNIEEECVKTLNYANCDITGNTMTNCGAGVLIQHMKNISSAGWFSSSFDGEVPFYGQTLSNLNINIKNNKITVKYFKNEVVGDMAAIKVKGYELESSFYGTDGILISSGNYPVSGVTITGNKITTAGYGVRISNGRNVTVSSNKIVMSPSGYCSKTYSGIRVDSASKSVSITSNTVSGFDSSAVLVRDSSSVKSISSNKLKNFDSYGILVMDSSTISGNISSNTIKSGDLSGIYIKDGSKVSGSIYKNKISSVGRHGIAITTSSKCSSVSTNTVSAKWGSALYIKNVKSTISLKSNSLKSSYATAVNVGEMSKKYVIYVSSNTVKGNNSSDGIYVANAAAEIKQNKISGSDDAIKLKSGVKASVSSNKLTGNKYNGIAVVGKSSSTLYKTSLGISGFSKSTKDKILSKKLIKKIKKKTIIKKKFKVTKLRKYLVSWDELEEADGYEVSYSKTSSMTDAKTFTTNNTSVALTKLGSVSDTVYVRVRAYYKIGDITVYGGYTSVIKAKIKADKKVKGHMTVKKYR